MWKMKLGLLFPPSLFFCLFFYFLFIFWCLNYVDKPYKQRPGSVSRHRTERNKNLLQSGIKVADYKVILKHSHHLHTLFVLCLGYFFFFFLFCFVFLWPLQHKKCNKKKYLTKYDSKTDNRHSYTQCSKTHTHIHSHA